MLAVDYENLAELIFSLTYPDSEIEILARKYALLNAVQHKGRADLGSVLGRILAERPELRKDAKGVRAVVAAQVAQVGSLNLESQQQLLLREFPQAMELEASRKKEVSRADAEKVLALPPLPKAVMGAVITRFPPEPNGFMHIGHAKAAIIGSEYAKMYSGKFIVRFDDTNPAAEKKEYYDAFLQSLNWLEIVPTLVRNSSDDMPRFYELAAEMIGRKKAYVCTCAQELMRANRNTSKECEHRSQTTEHNLSLWKRMLSGEEGKSFATLRFVGDMQSVNTTMRDPVLFRIVEQPHPIQNTRYKVWPTYDFDGPIEDSLDGVTHAMRSKEYELRDELYYAILSALELRLPKIIEFSRLSLQNTTVSKRSLKKLIEAGEVQDWDDPRLPTIAGLKRRGILAKAIRDFVLSMGVSKVESEPTWDLLESINRKLLDPVAKRYFFVPEPVKLTVKNASALAISLKNHPEKELGSRQIQTDGNFLVPAEDFTRLEEGAVFRLMEAYNVKVVSKKKEEIVGVQVDEGTLEAIPKVQWVALDDKLDFQVMAIGPLLLQDSFNPESLKIIRGVAESSVNRVPVGEILQFVRFGFCRIDAPGLAILAHK